MNSIRYTISLSTRLLFPLVLTIMTIGASAARANQIPGLNTNRELSVPVDAPNMELLSQIGGTAMAVAAADGYAYLGEGLSLLIIDVSDPTAASLVGRTQPLPGRAREIAIQGDYAFLAVGSAGLHIVDISDPANPTIVGQWRKDAGINHLAVAGDYAYVISGGFRVLNISDPSAPQEVGFYEVDANEVSVGDGYAYLAAPDGLHILNLADPAHPDQVGFIGVAGSSEHVSVTGDYVLLTVHDEYCGYFGCYEFNELQVIDASDRTRPIRSGSYEMGMSARDLASDGDLAFMTINDEVTILDISDPAQPTGLSSATTPGWAWQVATEGSYLFVADFHGGLRIISLQDTALPVEVGYFDTAMAPVGLVLSGDHAYIAAGYEGLQIVDIAPYTEPRTVGVLPIPGYTKRLAVANGMAFVADMDYGLHIIDISNPTMPTEVGFIDTPDGASDVKVRDNYSYVVSQSGGLRIIDVHDPSTPVEIGHFDIQHSLMDGLDVAGNYAYVADSVMGLHIIDIANPYSPKEVSLLDTPGYLGDVAVSGNYAYLADGNGGFLVADISNAREPRVIGHHGTPVWAVAVAINQEFVYVADLSGGVRVFNVSEPAAPVEVGFYCGGNISTHEAIADNDIVYVIDEGLGLLVIGHYGPQTISGRVTVKDGTPLTGAWISAGRRYAVSDAAGNYRLTRVQPGAYDVIATMPGYSFTPSIRRVSVPPNVEQINFTAAAWSDIWSAGLPVVNRP